MKIKFISAVRVHIAKITELKVLTQQWQRFTQFTDNFIVLVYVVYNMSW